MNINLNKSTIVFKQFHKERGKTSICKSPVTFLALTRKKEITWITYKFTKKIKDSILVQKVIRKFQKYYCSVYFSYKLNALQYVISIIIKPFTLYTGNYSRHVTSKLGHVGTRADFFSDWPSSDNDFYLGQKRGNQKTLKACLR